MQPVLDMPLRTGLHAAEPAVAPPDQQGKSALTDEDELLQLLNDCL